ncbi:MAG: YnbE family lipoprotein [Pseudomonadota bacterium]
MIKKLFLCTGFLSLFIFSGCQSSHQVEVKPVEIKPIHITIDVNVRVQKQLGDILDEIGR